MRERVRHARCRARRSFHGLPGHYLSSNPVPAYFCGLFGQECFLSEAKHQIHKARVAVATINCTMHVAADAGTGPPQSQSQEVQPSLGDDDLLYMAKRLVIRTRSLLLPQQLLEGTGNNGSLPDGDAGGIRNGKGAESSNRR